MDAAGGAHITQGDEDEGPLAHARMGDDAFRRITVPVPEEQQIHVDAARSEAQGRVAAALSAQQFFLRQQCLDEALRGPVGLQLHADDLIVEPGLIRIVLRFGQVDAGKRVHTCTGQDTQPLHGQGEHMRGIGRIGAQTDKNGEILSWKGDPSYHPENERNIGAQIAAGGSDRLENDDGGHLEARILGGAPGKENLVAMRSTINRGDWKCAENEIAGVLQRGGKVEDEGFIIREGNDSRPTKIVREYAYENIRKILVVDNVEGSRDLLEGLKDVLSPEDNQSLMDEVTDMVEDGNTVSVTSVSRSYENGLLQSICVGLRNETIGEKMYRTFNIGSTEKQEG